jgi:hypothetical protein
MKTDNDQAAVALAALVAQEALAETNPDSWPNQ